MQNRRQAQICEPMLSTARFSLPRTLRTRTAVARVHTASRAALSQSPLIHRPSVPSLATPLKTALPLSLTMSSHAESAVRPEPDQVLQDIADYVHNFKIESDLAFETARLCLIDTIGCGLEGLRFETCSRLLGPVVEGTVVPNGMTIPPFDLKFRI